VNSIGGLISLPEVDLVKETARIFGHQQVGPGVDSGQDMRAALDCSRPDRVRWGERQLAEGMITGTVEGQRPCLK
jgi:hypothetical protein